MVDVGTEMATHISHRLWAQEFHHLCAFWEGKNIDATSFTAEPGPVYYFAARVTVNSRYSLTFGLSQSNEDEGKYLVKESKLSTSKLK
jgi:hypothetical protein